MWWANGVGMVVIWCHPLLCPQQPLPPGSKGLIQAELLLFWNWKCLKSPCFCPVEFCSFCTKCLNLKIDLPYKITLDILTHQKIVYAHVLCRLYMFYPAMSQVPSFPPLLSGPRMWRFGGFPCSNFLIFRS